VEGKFKLVPKIADFGLSVSSMRKERPIPVRWTAPEIFLDLDQATPASDIWSFGVVLYEIGVACETVPYHGLSNVDVKTLVLSGGRLQPPTSCSVLFQSLMSCCLATVPSLRPSFSVLFESLKQEYHQISHLLLSNSSTVESNHNHTHDRQVCDGSTLSERLIDQNDLFDGTDSTLYSRIGSEERSPCSNNGDDDQQRKNEEELTLYSRVMSDYPRRVS